MSDEVQSAAKDAGSASQLPPARRVDAARVFEWLKSGWRLFLRNPGVWIALAVALGVIVVVLGLIPLVGGIAANLLMPVFAGGLLLGCKALAEGGELRFDHLIAGFRSHLGGLVMLGVYYVVGFVFIGAAVALTTGGAMTAGMMNGQAPGMAMGGALLAALVMLVLLIPLLMAIWFAPALVVFRDAAPLAAMRMSFDAWKANAPALLVTLVVYAVLGFVAALPFGLGFLVLIPVTVGALYAAYVDMLA